MRIGLKNMNRPEERPYTIDGDSPKQVINRFCNVWAKENNINIADMKVNIRPYKNTPAGPVRREPQEQGYMACVITVNNIDHIYSLQNV